MMKKLAVLFIILSFISQTAFALQYQFTAGEISFYQPDGFNCTLNDSEYLVFQTPDNDAALTISIFDAQGYSAVTYLENAEKLSMLDDITNKEILDLNGLSFVVLSYKHFLDGNIVYGKYINLIDENADIEYMFNYFSTSELTENDLNIVDTFINSISAPSISGTLSNIPVPETDGLNGTSNLPQLEKKILFRNAPWGISFTEAEKLFPEYDLYGITGEMMKFYPTIELYTGDYDWNSSPEYQDINIIGESWNKHFDVAGYKTSNIELLFAYTVVDGIITHEESDSRMYGARYKFESVDAKSMIDDMKIKLTSLYGDIDEEGKNNRSYFDYAWWIWKGANNTAVALTLHDDKDSEKDEVWISYFTYDGDTWLYEASDGEKERLLRIERSAAESGDTSGL